MQCSALTKNDTQCKRYVNTQNKYCHQHYVKKIITETLINNDSEMPELELLEDQSIYSDDSNYEEDIE